MSETLLDACPSGYGKDKEESEEETSEEESSEESSEEESSKEEEEEGEEEGEEEEEELEVPSESRASRKLESKASGSSKKISHHKDDEHHHHHKHGKHSYNQIKSTSKRSRELDITLMAEDLKDLGSVKTIRMPFRFTASPSELSAVQEGSQKTGEMEWGVKDGRPTVSLSKYFSSDNRRGVVSRAWFENIHSTAGFTMGVTLKGVKNNTVSVSLTEGRECNFVVFPKMPYSEKQEIANCEFNYAGVNFLSKYPGRTIENIRTGIHEIDEKWTMVKADHPVMSLLKKLSQKARKSAGREYVEAETSCVRSLIESMEADMRDNLPITDLAALALSFERVFTDKADYFVDPLKFSGSWIDNAELSDNISTTAASNGTNAIKMSQDRKFTVSGLLCVQYCGL